MTTQATRGWISRLSSFRHTQTGASTRLAALSRITWVQLAILCVIVIFCSSSTALPGSRHTECRKQDQATRVTRLAATECDDARLQSRYGQHAQTYRTKSLAAVQTAARADRLYRLRQAHQVRQAAAKASHQAHQVRIHQFQARARAARTVAVPAPARRNHQHQNQHNRRTP